METTVLCLANSKKEGERCIAGIDVRTGQWVRPVSRHTAKGEVPFHERQVEGGEPRLLDLVRMDLAHDGPAGFDYCHSKENRWIDPSPWTREGVATAGDIDHYICRGELILHTRGKYTHPALIEAKPLSERTTLELYEVTLLACEKVGGKWKASLTTTEGITLQDISVTDCVLVERLNAEEVIEKNGYAVISLSLPWTPPIEDWSEGAVGWKLLAGWIPSDEATVDVHTSHDTASSRTSADKDEPLLKGYYLQTTPEGGRWRLYDIREQDECRICEINAFDNRLEIQRLSGPYDAIIEHWNAGVQEQLICTNRIIEMLWHQDAPQAISDQLAAWHREEEARDFAALQSPAASTFSAADGERDFREWMDALNKQRDGEVEISAEERLHGGLDDFYAQEAEMERQLGAETDWKWIWSADAYRLRQLLTNKDSITLRKCLSDDELVEEYDSDYHLTQEERTLELRFERLSIHPARFLIHAEPKPHIPLDLARLLAQVKQGACLRRRCAGDVFFTERQRL